MSSDFDSASNRGFDESETSLSITSSSDDSRVVDSSSLPSDSTLSCLAPLWSAASSTSGSEGKISSLICNNPSPFVFTGNEIRYDYDRGVDSDTVFLVGSKHRTSKGGFGYSARHLIFNPSIGTLACGFDVDDAWKTLPSDSLISGYGNSSESRGSFLAGSRNKIEGTGDNNAIIASSHVSLLNSTNTAVIGVSDNSSLNGFTDAIVTTNMYALNYLHIGDIDDELPPGSSLYVNGDALVETNLAVKGNIDADTITVNTVVASHIETKSLYVTAGTATIEDSDSVGIIYANAAQGTVNIHLGTTESSFAAGRSLFIKDISLETGVLSKNNIYIWAPTNAKIETYNAQGSLVASVGGAYILNSNGGAVTFRYSVISAVPSVMPTWVIESQFIGNKR